jgi:hypothetical protein
MPQLRPESRDFFARRLASELSAKTHRTRTLFAIWVVAILAVIAGSAGLCLRSLGVAKQRAAEAPVASLRNIP